MKTKIQYSCQSCGYASAKWLGRCPSCESWNSFAEEKPVVAADPSNAAASLTQVRDEFRAKKAPDWIDLDEIEQLPGKPRLSTGMDELDRVLGGGLTPDAFTLLGGDPGIGKSTLLLQMARGLLTRQENLRMLYVSGEESLDQIGARAKRLGVKSNGRLFLAAETQLERVFASVHELKPHVIVLDSLQTFTSAYSQSSPGSVSQVREISARLMTLAKTAGIAVWLVGHVTKDGAIAGPKTIEHMVDTVLYFEGEGAMSYRLLRTVKNRFGNTRELGVFEMDAEGLREVTNPSSLFLTERTSPVPGTAIAASLEGTRPILVELQALVVSSGLAMPRRTAVGIDTAKISILGAILERHLGVTLSDRDLFFNVSGGFRLNEPGCDLASAAAIWSSLENAPIPQDWVFIGELALTGECRRVAQTEVRIAEAKKLGFKTVILPSQTPKAILDQNWGLKLVPITSIHDLGKLLR